MRDIVADLQLGLKELAAEDRDDWVPLALSDRLRDVTGLHEAQDIELVRTLALWDRRTAWGEDGAVTAVSWLKHNLAMAPGEAAAWVRLARHYDRHGQVADALDGRLISVAKLRLLVKAEKGREEAFASCVDGFVTIAQLVSLSELATVLAEWAAAFDGPEPHDDGDRSFRVHQVGDRGVGFLDCSVDDLEIVIAALEALDSLDPADGPEPPRSREQRWHDITIDIFRRALADKLGDEPSAPGSVDVIVDVETAVALVQDPNRDQDPLDEVLQPYRDADLTVLLRKRCHYPDGVTAGHVVAAALMCTGVIRRIVVDPQTGAVLDVGRSQRRFTKRQIRALVVRDGGCVFPGCDRKPTWTEAHHLKFWEDDGPTDLDNGCLLCRRHHNLIHHRGWRLERDKRTGVFTATAPDGRQFFRRPDQRC
jgi:hypothetical protein